MSPRLPPSRAAGRDGSRIAAVRESDLHSHPHQKRLRSLEEISAEIKSHQKRARQKLDGSHHELETLKQQAGQELEKLKK